MTPVTLQAVVDAMEMAGDEVTAYINRKTGEVVMFNDEEISYGEGDDAGCWVPEWQKEMAEQAKNVLADDNWIELPDQFDIDEYEIMERFCSSIEDKRVQKALFGAISGKGAFGRFRDRISEEGVRDDWFAFKDAAYKRIAAEFLHSQGISCSDEQAKPG